MKASCSAVTIVTEKMNALMYVINGSVERKLKVMMNVFKNIGLFVAIPLLFGLWINGNLGAWF